MDYRTIKIKTTVINGVRTVNLPHWRRIQELSEDVWIIEIPRDEYSKSKPHAGKIRAKYSGQKWDRETLEQEIEEMIVK